VTGQNLCIGLFTAVVLYARVDAFFLPWWRCASPRLATASSVVVEFNEIVCDPEDLNIIGHQPLPARTYAAARVTNLLAYVLLMCVSLNLFPAVVGVGLRDSGWWFLPLYSLAAVACNLLAAAAVILVYNLVLGHEPTAQLCDALAWLQVGLMFLIGYGGQWVIRDPQQQLAYLAYNLPDWVRYTPPGWLALAVNGTAPASGWRSGGGARCRSGGRGVGLGRRRCAAVGRLMA